MIKPLKNWIVTSPYGDRIHPISGIKKFHNGIDLSAPIGTPIYSPESGIIEDVNYNSVGGNQIFVKHHNNYRTTYSHLDSIVKNKNDVVIKGELIGYVGDTGAVTGAHLHYTVKFNDVRIDPESINYETLNKNYDFDKSNLKLPIILLIIVGIGITLIINHKK
mgnify:FL=1|tara:strand:+ start:2847 stop:3335 length:489 start_codon:yes stop_codon:yes gene_type:complete